MSKGYLTLFFRFALGLSLLLALTACKQQNEAATEAQPYARQTLTSQAVLPTRTTGQANSREKPTPLPAIPPTPNQLTPTNLGASSADLNNVVVEVWQPWSGDAGDVFKETLEAYSRINQWGDPDHPKGKATCR